MPVNKRSTIQDITSAIKIFPGPYVGYIKSATDVNRMGRLAVYIPDLHGVWDESQKGLSSQTVTVSYCSPFAGQTPLSETKKGIREYASTQKSYGFWMVPPDVDTKVLVMFANGDINQGFWIGCVFEDYMNHMTPGIANSKPNKFVGNDFDNDRYYTEFGLESAPVAEAQRKAEDSRLDRGNTDPDKDNTYPVRPVNPYQTDTLIAQGLHKDPVRGTTSSSARRETPSQVFGISTPGPIDFEGQQTSPRESINRHGKIFSGGGPNPGNTIAKVAHSRLGGHQFVMDDGTPPKNVNNRITQPAENELIRLRTRNGIQILMHATENLLYLSNARANAWIELTNDGKIDVYAEDSISVHTRFDVNLRADRDINIEAGRNINMKAVGLSPFSDDTATKGRIHMDAGSNIEMKAAAEIKQQAATNFKLYAGQNGKIEVGTNIDFYAGTDFLANTGNEIHMNTSGKVSAGHVGSSNVSSLTTYTNQGIFFNDNLAQAQSIMKRVPTREPYAEHENKRPDKTTWYETDRELTDEREIS